MPRNPYLPVIRGGSSSPSPSKAKARQHARRVGKAWLELAINRLVRPHAMKRHCSIAEAPIGWRSCAAGENGRSPPRIEGGSSWQLCPGERGGGGGRACSPIASETLAAEQVRFAPAWQADSTASRRASAQHRFGVATWMLRRSAELLSRLGPAGLSQRNPSNRLRLPPRAPSVALEHRVSTATLDSLEICAPPKPELAGSCSTASIARPATGAARLLAADFRRR